MTIPWQNEPTQDETGSYVLDDWTRLQGIGTLIDETAFQLKASLDGYASSRKEYARQQATQRIATLREYINQAEQLITNA